MIHVRPIHVLSLLSVVAAAAIVTGCGGALQPGQTTASTANTVYSSLFNGVPTDPYQAMTYEMGNQRGSCDNQFPGMPKKCVIEITRNKMGMWAWGTYSSQPAMVNLTGFNVPTLDGTMSAANFNSSSFLPTAIFPKDKLSVNVSGSWGMSSPNVRTWKFLGMEGQIQLPTSFNCTSTDLSGVSAGKTIEGNVGLGAGLMAQLIDTSGNVQENFLVKGANGKTFAHVADRGMLVLGLNVTPTDDYYWRQSLCMDVRVTTLHISRCFDASNSPVVCN